MPKPFWSVMIPSYNCASYLEKTIASVLNQSTKHDSMEIHIMDDCSLDHPELVVEKFKNQGVVFNKQSKNVGLTKNFNSCIERASGQLIHILHGDDYVASNFYSSFETAYQENPTLGLYSCRCFLVDENDKLLELSSRIKALENGSKDSSNFFYNNPFRTPGVVIQKSIYNNFGSFNEDFYHVSDWEMWIRAVDKSGGIFINQPLAYYREFSANDTSKLRKTANNLRDYLKLGIYFKSFYKDFCFSRFRNMLSDLALNQTYSFKKEKDPEAFFANKKFFMEIATLKFKIKWFYLYLRHFFRKYL